jgi:hypothetical protein
LCFVRIYVLKFEQRRPKCSSIDSELSHIFLDAYNFSCELILVIATENIELLDYYLNYGRTKDNEKKTKMN